MAAIGSGRTSDRVGDAKKRVIRTAVIGAGYWGRNIVRNVAGLAGADLVMVCDRDEAARRRAEKMVVSLCTTDDYEKVLADESIEAVIIATNVSDHYQHAKGALLAGKHVLVEKPLAADVAHARELVELADRQQKQLMVGHLMLYHPVVERLRSMIASGELGRIYYMYALRVNLGQVRRDENALWSFAPHDLSVINFLLNQQPLTVSARGRGYLREEIEDVVFVNLDYPDRTMAQIQLSWLDPHKERRLTVVGSRKMVLFDDTHPTEKLRVYDKGFDRPPEYDSYADYLSIRNGDLYVPHIAMQEPLTTECNHFFDCIREGTRPRSCGRNGLAVVQILAAAQASLDQGGKPVMLSDHEIEPDH